MASVVVVTEEVVTLLSTLDERVSDHVASAGVGSAILLGWPLCSGIVLYGLVYVIPVLVMGPLLWWFLIVYPHAWLVRRSGYTAELVFTEHQAILVAGLQWLIVALFFGIATSGLSKKTRFWLAPAIILVVGIAFHIMVGLLGLQVEADWL